MEYFIDKLVEFLNKTDYPFIKEDFLQITFPPKPEMGDLTFPCFLLAKRLKKKPQDIAKEIAEKIDISDSVFKKVEINGPYINFTIFEKALAEKILTEILEKKSVYGKSSPGKGKTIVIDYSSPNIAKPFGIGHLRSTVIGAALYRLYKELGYKVIGINHLGDWGTQFGLLMLAFREKGDTSSLQANPVEYLYNLYVEYNKKSESDPDVMKKARLQFKLLEEGDSVAVELWKKFKELSLEGFKEIYQLLGVDFDYYTGESFYNDRIKDTLKAIKEKGLLKESEGALIVDLSSHNLPPCLLKKQDGATLYSTRDLTAAIYRYNTFHFDKILYVVGTPQSLHFQQIINVLQLLGFPWAKDIIHVNFGHIVGISTRRGSLIFLKDVLDKSIEKALQKIEENVQLRKIEKIEDKEKVAKAVGIGAIIFNDLKNKRIHDVVFDWDQMLNFEGETGPYLQYTHARICGIIRKSAAKINSNVDFSLLKELETKNLIIALANYPDVIKRAALEYEPSILSNYLLELTALFNVFYNKYRVLGSGSSLEKARLFLVDSARQVLVNGLRILGLVPLERM